MTIERSVIKNLIIALVVLVITVAGVYTLLSNKKSAQVALDAVVQDGDTQIVSVTAKGGYSPRIIQAKAGQKTVLKMLTKNTFDCSSALIIPKLGVHKILPASGETAIEIPAQAAGSVIDASCAMGMYSFQINFV
jgi:Cu+-exporting ATPase